jgi:diguanylate cyclase (GGDEF)-like protein
MTIRSSSPSVHTTLGSIPPPTAANNTSAKSNPDSTPLPAITKALLAGSVGLNVALAGTTAASLHALTCLEKDTSTDALTGLHTKAFILQHGNEVVENLRKANPNQEVYAFHMDLNGLKLMNDFMSKHHGDKLLQLVQPVVAEKTSPTETALFRYGSSGDEFELFMTANNQEHAAKKMKAIQMNMLRQTHQWPEITYHLKREGDRIGRTYNSLQDYIVYQEYLKARELMQSPPSWENFRKAAVTKLDDRIRKPLGLTVAGMKLADSIASGKPHQRIDFKDTLHQLTQMEGRARNASKANMDAFYAKHEKLTPENRHEFVPGLVFESRENVRRTKVLETNGIIPKISLWNNAARLVKRLFRV